MKVWIVFEDYGYDGCSQPFGVYESLDAAKAAVNFYWPQRNPSSLEYIELEIGAPISY